MRPSFNIFIEEMRHFISVRSNSRTSSKKFDLPSVDAINGQSSERAVVDAGKDKARAALEARAASKKIRAASKAKPPPAGYVCARCGDTTHYIRYCPRFYEPSVEISSSTPAN